MRNPELPPPPPERDDAPEIRPVLIIYEQDGSCNIGYRQPGSVINLMAENERNTHGSIFWPLVCITDQAGKRVIYGGDFEMAEVRQSDESGTETLHDAPTIMYGDTVVIGEPFEVTGVTSLGPVSSVMLLADADLDRTRTLDYEEITVADRPNPIMKAIERFGQIANVEYHNPLTED